MNLSFRDKQHIKGSVTVVVNWFNPNKPSNKSSSVYFLEATTEQQEDYNITSYTLSFYVYNEIRVKAKEKGIHELYDLNGKKIVLETDNYTKEHVKKSFLETSIGVDHDHNIYAIQKQDWSDDSELLLTDKKKLPVVVDSLIYEEVEEVYDDIKIRTHRDVFGALIELNRKAIYKNPTISLLLRLIEYGSSNYNYTPVFLEWYKEQFINPKDDYREEFGGIYKQQYQQLKEPLRNSHFHVSTTEPVVDEPQEIIEPDDTLLTHDLVFNAPHSDHIDPANEVDFLSEKLVSNGLYDEALTNKDDIEYLELPEKHREAVVKARIGQGYFRDVLVNYWGECAITKCKEISLLKASHIKPWAKCDSKEAVDPFNGFLLSPTLDAAFDKGFITFDDTGKVIRRQLTCPVATTNLSG